MHIHIIQELADILRTQTHVTHFTLHITQEMAEKSRTREVAHATYLEEREARFIKKTEAFEQQIKRQEQESVFLNEKHVHELRDSEIDKIKSLKEAEERHAERVAAINRYARADGYICMHTCMEVKMWKYLHAYMHEGKTAVVWACACVPCVCIYVHGNVFEQACTCACEGWLCARECVASAWEMIGFPNPCLLTFGSFFYYTDVSDVSSMRTNNSCVHTHLHTCIPTYL